ncbi:MAG: MEDS domain-containing protein, partial [Thermodesulfobacteriota bacterium]
LASGQLVILTRDDAYMREGVFDPDGMIALLRGETERALAEGYPALRVTGEMTWALRGLPGSERLIEYEARLNEFFPGSKCLAICQYDRRRFDPAVLLDVLRTHPIAVVGTEVYDNFYYIPPAELLGSDLPVVELRRQLQNLAERKRVEEALQYRIEFENLITAISTNFINLAPDEIDSGINHALRTIGEFADVDRSYVFLFSDNGTKMDMTHEWCDEGIEPLLQIPKGLSVDDFPWQTEKIKRRETIHIPRVADLPSEASALREDLQSQEVESLIQVPMICGESVVGFLGFDSQRWEKTWTEDIIALLRIVGDIFTNALERRRAGEEIRQNSEDLTLIITLNNAVNRGDSLQEVIQVLARETKRIFSSHGATVYLLSEDRKHLVMQNLTLTPAMVNRIEKLIGMKMPAIRVPLKAGSLYLKALQEGKPQLINDPRTIQRLIAEFTESKMLKKLVPKIFPILNISSVINVPLVSESEAIGLLDISSNRHFTESDLHRLETLSGQLTTIIKRKRAEEATKLAYEELDQIFQTAADGMRVIDKDFNVLRVNETFLALAGVSRDEVVSKKCYEVFPGPQCHTPCLCHGQRDGPFRGADRGTS